MKIVFYPFSFLCNRIIFLHLSYKPLTFIFQLFVSNMYIFCLMRDLLCRSLCDWAQGMGLSEKLPSDLNCLVLKTQRNYKMASLLIYPSLQYLLFPLILISCTALFALNRLYIYIILDLDECILLFVTSDFL